MKIEHFYRFPFKSESILQSVARFCYSCAQFSPAKGMSPAFQGSQPGCGVHLEIRLTDLVDKLFLRLISHIKLFCHFFLFYASTSHQKILDTEILKSSFYNILTFIVHFFYLQYFMYSNTFSSFFFEFEE